MSARLGTGPTEGRGKQRCVTSMFQSVTRYLQQPRLGAGESFRCRVADDECFGRSRTTAASIEVRRNGVASLSLFATSTSAQLQKARYVVTKPTADSYARAQRFSTFCSWFPRKPADNRERALLPTLPGTMVDTTRFTLRPEESKS